MKMKTMTSFLSGAALIASALLAPAANLLTPGLPVIGVAANSGSAVSAVATAGTAAGVNNYPAGEPPGAAIDAATGTKYLNFAKINTGLIVTIPGGLTTVTGVQFNAANDAAERDPLTITIEGTSSSDPTTAAGGSSWTLLYSGPSGLATDPGRFVAGAALAFNNALGFNTYRLLVTDVRNQGTANSVQFSEVQFIGTTAPDLVAPTISSVAPVAGTVGGLNTVMVTFSEAVTGVNASDLLVNGTPANSVSGNGQTYTFTVTQPPLGSVQVGFATDHGITDFGTPPNELDETAPAASWQYTLVDNTPPTVVGRAPIPSTTVEQLNTIQVNFSEPVTGVNAADLLINSVPATNLVIVSPSIYTFEFASPATGTVNVAFAPAHGITDQAAAPNAFAGLNWNYVLDPGFQFTQFLITEFLAANSGNEVNSLRDEDGDSSDWIEIYNPDLTVGNIGGYFLTDATGTPTKWRFPSGMTVPGRGYLVVFASGKNRTNLLGRLHTNFQLNNSGEFLALLDPKTNVVSQYFPTYPSQDTDISYGRDRNSPSVLGYYNTPTPGAHNLLSGQDFGPRVDFSRLGGTFVGSFQLTLSVPDPTSVIRYTLVNAAQNVANATNIPTAASTLYTGPITLTNTLQVRARAFPANTNFFPGPPRTESFIQVNPALAGYVSTLPIVVIHTLSAASFSGGYPALDNSVTIACFDNTNGTASLLATPQMIKRAGINLRGSSTQGFPKSSFAVELWDEFNADEEASFLGLPKESDWVLYAPNQFDLSLMHNPLLHQFGRDMGYYSSRTRYVEVFIRNGSGALTGTTNATGAAMGDYNGVYVLEEKVKRDGNRVDIDELKPEITNAPAITGGYLLKIDRTDGNERTFSAGGETINYQDPDGLEMVTPVRAPQAAYIASFFNLFNAALQFPTLTNATGTNHYTHYLDVDATLDLHIANVLTLNVDGYRLSGYLYKPRNGKLVMGPLWDCDRGQGTSRGDGRSLNPRCWQSSTPSGSGGTDNGTDFFQGATPPVWLGRMFGDLDLWQRWIDRYQNMRTGVLDTNRIGAIIDQMAGELRAPQVREAKRWSGSGGGSDTSPRNGVTTTFNADYTHTFNGTYQGEVDFQKRWYYDRINFIDTNFLNRPLLSATQGLVASGTMLTLADITGKAGTKIYYTLDGTDPRAAQGRTNVAALEYTGPITITNNIRIRARAVNAGHRNMTGITGVSATVPNGTRNPLVSSTWSGDSVATLVVTTPPLIVTELMFHPASPVSDTDTNDAGNFEYIELKNIGSTTLNLSGFRFTNGIDFTFAASNGVTTIAPGGYLLVVKNVTAFTSRYGAAGNIAGAYLGNFDDSGERITLVGALQEPILDFVYDNNWFPLTDGTGFSLVAQNDTAFSNLSTNTAWRQSSLENGSPGAANPAAPVLSVVLINEALTHTDLPQIDTIELFNPGTNSVDLGGWFLTDDFGTPRKFEIPPGTLLPAGGFLLFDEDQFNIDGTNFSLSSAGDQVYLFSGAGGLLSGFYHGFGFGAAQNGVTFGRHLNSQGEEGFVAQVVNTLGASNSLPLVGPVVISEIMYHPPETGAGTNLLDNGFDEFIELRNVTATNVPLYHVLYPSNTWKLSSAVDFSFPTNQTLAPDAYALVVSFDPGVPASLAAFRARFSVPAQVPVYGPYSGKLDNSTESVRLRRPDAPNGLDVPFILVDRVDYSHVAPWDIYADGLGASLQRLVPGDFGDEPTNWIAASTSAGFATQGGAPPQITQQPMSVTVVENRATNLSVVVSSATTVSYQWRLNSNAVPGETSATLFFPAIQLSQAGSYTVTVLNGGGVAFSMAVQVTVLPVPVISQQPQSQNVQPGTNFTVSVAATGTGPLSYQWRFNGVNIAGATASSLSYSNAQLATHAGLYDVLITDNTGTRFSQSATLIVLVKPVITTQLVPVTVVQGQTARFSVVAGPVHPLLPLYYRWLRNGALYVSNALPDLVITNAQSNGNFRVTVGNLAGTVNSVPAGGVSLTVLPDTDQDGIPDSYESSNGLNPTSAADGVQDPDGDLLNNYGEYVAGTNPTNALSVLQIQPLQFTVDGDAVLQVVAVSNRTYNVDFRNDFGVGWTNLFVVSPAPTNRTISLTNSLTTPMRFYRIAIPAAQ